MANALLQQRDTGLDLVQLQVLVGLVGPVDGARAHDDGFHAQLLQERRLGSEGHRLGPVPGEALGQAHQFAVRGLLEG